jgi:hypothetical protein
MGSSIYLVLLEHETMKTISRETLRAALRAQFGAGNYRITQNDEVHIYGLMPNARTVGWWLMGDILSAELWLGLHDGVVA